MISRLLRSLRESAGPRTLLVLACVTTVVLSVGGGATAARLITGADIKNSSIEGKDVKNGTLQLRDISDASERSLRGRPGATGATGAKGATGATGATGAPGPAGSDAPGARWVLIDATGQIEAQSGGFTIASAYDAPGTPAGAVGNVYIDAGEDLSGHAVVATIALQNQIDQNGDTITNGRSLNPDANPEFSGEITATRCAVAAIVACAPTGTNTPEHLVVSPRLSDGQVTTATTRKRFYVVIV
ncbi:hypothetical protein [Solicola sp. PLA-1-18]|uniref:hypothetical protein n=1 Tax=Solicola sp. PLA-1-18 TaxID=3380532 RepID=UPI003B799467